MQQTGRRGRAQAPRGPRRQVASSGGPRAGQGCRTPRCTIDQILREREAAARTASTAAFTSLDGAAFIRKAEGCTPATAKPMKQASAFGNTPGWNIARHQQPTAAKCTNQQLAGTPLAREVPRPTSHEDLHEESSSRVPAGGGRRMCSTAAAFASQHSRYLSDEHPARRFQRIYVFGSRLDDGLRFLFTKTGP